MRLDTSVRRQIVHGKEGTHGLFYRPKNIVGEEAPHRSKAKLNHHKFRKPQTAMQPISGGSGGISRIAFSTTNPSGASMGARFGKWSGEMAGYSNVSGVSAEEGKRSRKDFAQLSCQTAFQMKGRGGLTQFADPAGSDGNGGFTDSDLDVMQNVEEGDREVGEHRFPHVTNTSHLEMSGAHSLNTYKAGLSSAKGQQKRLTVDPLHGGEDEGVIFGFSKARIGKNDDDRVAGQPYRHGP